MFLLGVHRETGEITDFGGGIKKKENDLSGGFRELSEETKGIFDSTTSEAELGTCIGVYKRSLGKRRLSKGDGGMSAIFVPVDNSWIEDADKLFSESKKNGLGNNEIEELVWCTEAQLLSLISGKKVGGRIMWFRLCRFYETVYEGELRDLISFRFRLFTPHFQIKKRIISTRSVERVVICTKISFTIE